MNWIIYGTAWKKERTTLFVQAALDAGFRAIDTANQPKHYSEALVGEAVKAAYDKGIEREKLFLQTKFTSPDGQDQRIPYNPEAPIAEQVEQSFQSSLEHLHTDYLDSYLLHGPYSYPNLIDEDWQVWEAMEKLYESGKVKQIGISNVHPTQLQELLQNARIKPMAVQNRCYAVRGWDLPVRALCAKFQVSYQGFSLLTANPDVVHGTEVRKIAERLQCTPAQVIFAFAKQVGMIPLTGTTDPIHMRQDLAAEPLQLTPTELSQLHPL